MARDKREAAQMRASQIRTLRGLRTGLIEDPADRKEMEAIIDRQLASMGAETIAARKARSDDFWYSRQEVSSKAIKKLMQTACPYTITDEDVKRYDRW